jgi:nicotinate-nucleotide adenylyltransferase
MSRDGSASLESPAPVVPGSLGILGGTFDPIHLGHLAIAEEVRETLGLERLLFVPAGIPPHRPTAPAATAEDRLAMVRLAVADNPAFLASAIELERDGPSFSVDTVEQLAAEVRRAGRRPDLWFVLSAEAFGQLHTWHEPERLLVAARVAVVPRAGAPQVTRAWVAAHFRGYEDRVRFLDGPQLGISGTSVRARAAAGRSLRYLVPEEVARYIESHRLYRTPAAVEMHRP